MARTKVAAPPRNPGALSRAERARKAARMLAPPRDTGRMGTQQLLRKAARMPITTLPPASEVISETEEESVFLEDEVSCPALDSHSCARPALNLPRPLPTGTNV